jgi:hypothetical protein
MCDSPDMAPPAIHASITLDHRPTTPYTVLLELVKSVVASISPFLEHDLDHIQGLQKATVL